MAEELPSSWGAIPAAESPANWGAVPASQPSSLRLYTTSNEVSDAGIATGTALDEESHQKLDNAKPGDTINLKGFGDVTVVGNRTFKAKNPDAITPDTGGPLESGVRSFVAGLPGAGGAAVGIGAVRPAAEALGNIPRIGPVLSLGTNILGGIGGALLADTAKEAISPDTQQFKDLRAQDIKENPKSSMVGGIASQAPFFGVTGASLAQRGVMAGIGAGIPVVTEAGKSAITGDPIEDGLVQRALAGGIGGAIFANPTKAGEGLIAAGGAIPGVNAVGRGIASIVPKPPLNLNIQPKGTGIVDSLGDVKAGDPQSKVVQASNEIALKTPDNTVLEPPPPLDLPQDMGVQRQALQQELRANPLEAINAQVGTPRELPQVAAKDTILAEIERRAAAKQAQDQAQIQVNDALGVRQPEVPAATSTILAERLANDVSQIPHPDVQAARAEAFNKRVIDTQANLAREGVELDRQTAVKLANITDPAEFNAARQQLIDSVKTTTPDIPKQGPIKSLQDIPTPPREAAPATFRGIQQGIPEAGIPDFELYDLTRDIPGHPEGSTVSRHTLEQAGFEVPASPTQPEPVKTDTNAIPEQSTSQVPILDIPRNGEALGQNDQELRQPAGAQESVGTNEAGAPSSPLDEKLAYLDEQLAAREITKAEHKQLTKEARKSNAGFINPYVASNVAAPAIGAAVGFTQGDTPEERLKNAALYAAAFSGGTAALTAISKNPELLKNFTKSLANAREAASKRPSLYSRLTAEKPVTPTTPDEVGSDKILPKVGERPAWEPGLIKNKALGEFLDKTYTTVDGIREVAPEIAGAVRNWVHEEMNLISSAHSNSISPVTRLRELVGDKNFEGPVMRALYSGNEEGVLAALDATPEGKIIADQLRDGWIKDRPEVLKALREANPNASVGEVENYWPRMVSDLEGLRKEIGATDKSFFDRAIKAAQAGKEEPLTNDEIVKAINNELARASISGPSTAVGALKPRQIKDINDALLKFYEPPDVALAKYYERAYKTILTKKYLGRTDPEATVNFVAGDEHGILGKLVAQRKADGTITSAGEDRIAHHINGFTKATQGSNLARAIAPKIGYLQVASNLGQLTSALANFNDVFTSAATTSARDAFAGFFIDPLISRPGKKGIADLGLHEGSQEVYQHARAGGPGEKVLNNLILPLFKYTDRLGKEGSINTALRHFERGVEARSQGKEAGRAFDTIESRYKEMYGQEEWKKLYDAFDAGDFSNPAVNKFAYNALAEIQPLSKAEMVLGKHEASVLGKTAFGLTSFMLRQANLARSNIYNEWRIGNKANAVQFASKYMAYMAMGSFMMGAIKSFISGDDISTENQFFSTMLQMVGLNRVAINQIEKGHMAEALGERVLPGVFGPIEDVGHDALLVLNKLVGGNKYPQDEGFELLKRVPLIGKPLYDTYGQGATKREAKARQRTEPKTDLQQLKESILGADNQRRGR